MSLEKDIFDGVNIKEYGQVKRELVEKLDALAVGEVCFFESKNILKMNTFRMYVSSYKKETGKSVVTKSSGDRVYVKRFS